MCVPIIKINYVGKWTSLKLEDELFDNSMGFFKHHIIAFKLGSIKWYLILRKKKNVPYEFHCSQK